MVTGQWGPMRRELLLPKWLVTPSQTNFFLFLDYNQCPAGPANAEDRTETNVELEKLSMSSSRGLN